MEVAALLSVIVVVAAVTAAAAYNAVASLRQDVRDAWAAMDRELHRRAELLTPLINAARASGAPAALAETVAARNRAAVALNPDQLAAAESDLSDHLRQVLDAPPPSLAARPEFARCRSDLTAADAAITAAGRRYNDAVGSYNAALASFPTRLAAAAFGFGPQVPFGLR